MSDKDDDDFDEVQISLEKFNGLWAYSMDTDWLSGQVAPALRNELERRLHEVLRVTMLDWNSRHSERTL